MSELLDFYRESLEILSPEEISRDYPIGQVSWLKAGGAADFLVQPESTEKLTLFLEFLRKNAFLGGEVTILGAMSNVLVRDGGVRGIVINLLKSLRWWKVDAAAAAITESIAFPAGLRCTAAFLNTQKYELSGMEFIAGIPGTIGGAVFMNAGAHGTEINDIIDWVDIVTFDGEIKRLWKKDLRMQYRNGNFGSNEIIVQAGFNLQKSEHMKVYTKGIRFLQERAEKFPSGGGIGTAGSTFKNPTGISKLAWQLIDEAGCRGMKLGNAMISEKHANFLVNLGGASARDLEDLGEKVRIRVFEKCGIMLEWEIVRIGTP
ncbi:MAG: UDP-N-acetylmuramate dehydrogenase [Holosporales bacterium]|jgi:UDP-N-acetylmuramate dehydrogenase|nr:UDP-N-acetylmuramate dehydrogenase [Holosporales bacterium]